MFSYLEALIFRFGTLYILLALSLAACGPARAAPSATAPATQQQTATFPLKAPTPTPMDIFRMSSGEIISREQLTQMETQDPTVAKQIDWLHTWGDWYGSADPSIRPMVAEEARNNIVFYQWAGSDGSVHYKAAWKFDQGYPGFILVPPAINWQELNPPVAASTGHEIGPGQGPVLISTQCTEGSDLAKTGVPVGAQLIPEAGTGDWVMVNADTVVARVNTSGVWERVSNRPDGLATVPEGYSAVRNPDGTWGYGVRTGADVTPVPDLTVDASGAHFILDGVRIDIPASTIKDRIQVGQSGALQIYNEAGTAINYAYDTKNSEWVEASKVIQPDIYHEENFIKVNSEDELQEIFRLEKMFLLPFPSDTYWPDKPDTNYEGNGVDGAPLGHLVDLSKSPTRLGVNNISWGDMVIITEQVYNHADGTFSCLHIGDLVEYFESDSIQYMNSPKDYLMPAYRFAGDPHTYAIIRKPLFDYLAKKGYYTYFDWDLPKIKNLVKDWLTGGKVPFELENIILYYQTAVY